MFMFTPWRLLEHYILRVRVFLDHFLRTRLVWVFGDEDALHPLSNSQLTPLNSN